jgi:hypothetical protein
VRKPHFLLVLSLHLHSFADLADLLQGYSALINELISLGHIEANHEEQFGIFSAEGLCECSEAEIAELVEVYELLLV